MTSRRFLDVEVPLPSGVRVDDNRARVLLPEGYGSGGRAYPTLYLLHGGSNDFRSWSENVDLERLTRGLDLIVVMPDGGGRGELGYYSDWADGSRQWETYHTRTLVEFIDGRFRTLGGRRRAVAGLSMGGFGALKYAARHPDVYGAVAAFSAAADLTWLAPFSGWAYKRLPRRLVGEPHRVWGDQRRDRGRWREHSPSDLAPRLAGMPVLLSWGTGIVGGAYWARSSLALGLWEWPHAVMTRRVLARLRQAGGRVETFVYRGQHAWPYWSDALEWALPRLARAVG
ncbi:MAG: alpha/beta fold hydrolase [Elusimicrobia bacterium]|nr:alpha/beta fold hydrolase [Elusimicrobiota bacterium]